MEVELLNKLDTGFKAITSKTCKFCGQDKQVKKTFNKFVVYEYCTCGKSKEARKVYSDKVKRIKKYRDEILVATIRNNEVSNIDVNEKDRWGQTITAEVWKQIVEKKAVLKLCGYDNNILKKVTDNYKMMRMSNSTPLDYYNSLSEIYMVIMYGE